MESKDKVRGWWVDHPWRLIQTNLREIDMADIDAAEYVRQLESFDATIAMINVGGIISSYPTRLEDHFQSQFLTGDSLEIIIRACHDAGIRVIARNDFSKIRRPVYERHPDWAYRTAAGEIVDYNGDVHTCLNGGYQQEYAKEIIREIVTTLDVDGMFFNMGGFLVRDYSYNHYGPCHCDSCRRRFRDETGFDLSRIDDDAAARAAYEAAKQSWSREHEDSIYRLIKGLRPEVAVDHFDFQRQESNTEIDRPLPRWQYDASSNTRWVRTSKPGVVPTNTTVDFIGFFYRHVAVNPAQQELRLWQSLANGGALDYYLIGRLDNHRDRSGFDRVRSVFAFHKRNEAVYRRLESEADVLLVRGERFQSPEDRGWVRFLTEGHFLFDEVLLSHLDNANLRRYASVILPDVRDISDAQAERLDAFVQAGGTLVASGRTGMAGDGARVLSSLGIEEVEAIRDDMRSAVFEFGPGEEVLGGAESDLLAFGDTYLFARYAGDAETHLRLIPPHHFGPPERCYWTQTTDRPGFVVHPYGSGRSVYLPWYPGRLFYREGYVNTASFIVDLLAGVAGIAPLATNAGPMAEITVQRSVDDPTVRLVSIVNTSGHYATTVYDPVPMKDVTVSLASPERPSAVVSLRDGRAVPFGFVDGVATFTVDVDGACEVVGVRG